MRSIILFSCLTALAGCGPSDEPADFRGATARLPSEDAIPNSDPAPQQAAPEKDVEIRTVTNERDRIIDTFLFPAVEQLIERAAVPTTPLQLKAFTWRPGPLQTATFTVAAAGDQVKNAVKKAPRRITDTNANARFALFLVVDSSESTDTPTYKARYGDVADRLVTTLLSAQYANSDAKIVVCGLEDNGNVERRIINRGAASVAELQTSVRAAIAAVTARTGTGAEKVFRSLAMCSANLPAGDAMTIDTIRGYFALTDAANCLNSDGTVTATCDQAADQARYLFDSALQVDRHLSALGFYFRKTNGGICDDREQVEATSQYEAAVAGSLAVLYPTIADAPGGITGPGDLAGNFCEATTDGSFYVAADNFTSEMHHLRSHRIRITNAYDSFPSDPGYDLAYAEAGTPVPGMQRDGVIGIVDERMPIGGPIVATYHQADDYRHSVFPGFLAPRPDPAFPVTLNWAGASVTCVNAAVLGAGDSCRYFNSDFEYRLGALPPTDPVTTPLVPFTVRYRNEPERRNSFDVVAGDQIRADTLDAAGPAGAMPILETTFSPDRSRVTVKLSNADLPPGTYVIRYGLNDAQPFAHDVILAHPTSFLCYTDGATASIQDGVLKIEPASAILPCGAGGERVVTFRGDGTSRPQDFKVALQALIAPQPFITLEKVPDVETVTVTITTVETGVSRPTEAATFVVDGQKVVFTQALQPGEKAVITYARHPPLPGPVFPLSGSARDGVYQVRLGTESAMRDLTEPADYTLTLDPVTSLPVVTLVKNGTWGERLEVSYKSSATP